MHAGSFFEERRAQKIAAANHGMRTTKVPVAIEMDQHMGKLDDTSKRKVWLCLGVPLPDAGRETNGGSRASRHGVSADGRSLH